MYIVQFLRALYSGWISAMSSTASVVFTFWAILVNPQNASLRRGLWLTSLICFFVAAYRAWAPLYRMANEVDREFNEIKVRLLLSPTEVSIARELQRLRDLLCKNSSLFNRADLRGFYMMWIAPLEVLFDAGALLPNPVALNFTGSDYRQMKEQIAKIDLRSASTDTKRLHLPTAIRRTFAKLKNALQRLKPHNISD